LAAAAFEAPERLTAVFDLGREIASSLLRWLATAANQQSLGHATADLTLAAGP
jgi:DNA ligase (NAD+)